jgi:hypothetical protein
MSNAARIAASACVTYNNEMLAISGGNDKINTETLQTLHFILREKEHCELLANLLLEECKTRNIDCIVN